MTGRSSIASTAELSAFNAGRILEALTSRGPTGAVEVADLVGLSRAATDRGLRTLIERDLVHQRSAARTTPGRPTVLYEFHRGLGALVAVDVGPHTARARVDPLSGPVVVAGEPPVHVRDGVTSSTSPAERLALVEAVVDEALAAADVRPDQVWVAAAATPGIVDHQGSISRCDVIDGWRDDVLRAHLAARFAGAAIVVENDANAAAVAEYVHGAAAGRDEVAVVHAGSRVGMGLLRRGELYRGAHGQAGEFAHLPGTPWRTANDALLAAGAPPAPDRLGEVAAALADALRDLVFTVDPEVVVLAGPLAQTGEPLLGAIRDRVPEGYPVLPELALSPVGPADVLLGAAELARRAGMERVLASVTAER